MKKYIKYIAAVVVLVVLVIIATSLGISPQVRVGSADTSNIYYGNATSNSVVCSSTVPTLLIGTSTGSRTYIYVADQSANEIFLDLANNVSSTTLVIRQGIQLAASTTIPDVWTLGDPNIVYGGSIYCEAVGGSASTTVETIP